MTDQEREYIALTCIAAACADGHLSSQERQRIQTLVDDLGFGGRDLFRDAFARPVDPDSIAAALTSPGSRRTAYEMAGLVCAADSVLSDTEERFLRRLQTALGLSEAAATGIRLEVAHYADPGLPPVESPKPAEAFDADQAILRYGMLAAAAELLPQAASTLIVLPLQLKLVYEIGQRHGMKVDRGQVLDLAATFGIGATSQVMDSIARRILGGVARGVGGRLLGGLVGGVAGAATGALVSFTTTYALGHSAEVYYGKGRTLSKADLQALFDRFQNDAKTLYPKVEAEVRTLASGLSAEELLQKVRSMA